MKTPAILMLICLFLLSSVSVIAQPDTTPDPTSDMAAGATAEVTDEVTLTPSPTAIVLETLPTARFETSTPRPLTGQVFTIDLIITLPPGFELVDVPQFSDPWGEFELRSSRPIERQMPTEEAGNGTADRTAGNMAGSITDIIWQQQLEVVLWQPRDYVTPETFIGYRQAGFADVLRLPVTPLNVTVPTVLDFEDLTLRPYKPLIYLPYLSPWVVLLAVGLTAAVVILAVRLWKRRHPRLTDKTPVIASSSVAWIALDDLSQSAAAPDQRVIEAANILRRYLDSRTGVGLGERAATIDSLYGRLSKPALEELNSLLQRADLVKFSGMAVSAGEAERYLERCQHWLKTVDDMLSDVTVADVLVTDASA